MTHTHARPHIPGDSSNPFKINGIICSGGRTLEEKWAIRGKMGKGPTFGFPFSIFGSSKGPIFEFPFSSFGSFL
jgi:hypothetical protein